MMNNTNEFDALSFELTVFYEEVRSLVVLFLIVVLLSFLAHVTLCRLFTNPSNIKINRTDKAVQQIVLGICTFTLTISFAGYFLTPFFIIANQILFDFKHSYYFQWLDPRLVRDLILIINWGAKIVCVLLPFSYFLLTSVGLFCLGTSFTGRFVEASLNVVFSYILTCGTFWSCSMVLTFLRHNLLQSCTPFVFVDPFVLLFESTPKRYWVHILWDVIQGSILWCVQSVHLSLSFLGLFLLFISTPLGLVRLVIFLISSVLSKASEVRSKEQTIDKLTEVYYQALQVKDSVQSVSRSALRHRWFDSASLLTFEDLVITRNAAWRQEILCESRTQLSELHQHFCILKHRISPNLSTLLNNFFQPVFPYAILCLLFCMFHITQSFVFLNILSLLKNLAWSLLFPSNSTDQVHSGYKDSTNAVLGSEPASSLGNLGAFLQICIVHFLLFASLWGIYSIPSLHRLRPRLHSLSLEGILANVLLMFLFSSALPLQSNLLGLTALTLPNFFHSGCDPSSSDPSARLCLELQNIFARGFGIVSENSQTFVRQKWVFASGSDDACGSCVAQSCLPASADPKRNFSSVLEPAVNVDNCPAVEIHSENRTVSASNTSSQKLNVVILLYNLVFLATSIWIAGRRLGGVTLTVGLEVVTSLRCLRVEQELSPF